MFAMIIGIPLAAWRAFVAIQIWNWFVVPAFGIPAPDLWLTAGLLALATLATYSGAKTAYDDIEEPIGKMVYLTIAGLLIPATILFGGWVYHLLSGV